jgi:uncharacterized membrane protein YgaE (UPF0421/DUF939 family)
MERRPISALAARFARMADESRRQPLSLQQRMRLLRQSRLLIAQFCVACTVAWVAAHSLLNHPQPFFAPIAAVLSLAGGAGQRWRAVLDLVLGVAIGVAIGELMLSGIGRGTWQLLLVVLVAAVAAVFSGLSRMALLQAVNSAVLISVIVPVSGGTGGPAVNRFLDALVGGVVGLLVVALMPSNPARRVASDVTAVLAQLTGVLERLARSLRLQDPGQAWTALQEARAMTPLVESVSSTLESATEVSRVSPMRWRQRDHIGLYSTTWRHVDNAVRDARVLCRRVETMLRRGVAIPTGLDDAVENLARAVRTFSSDLSERDRFDEAVELLVETARAATIGLTADAELSAVAAVAQLRALAADLIYATGMTSRDVDRLFRISETGHLAADDPGERDDAELDDED